MVDWTLAAEEVIALPLDELALRVLADAHAGGTWNWRNWMISAGQHHYPRNAEAMRALSEAWTWLMTKGLVAWNPTQSSEAAIFVTRRGQEVLEQGLAYLRAVERLDIDLHPVLESKARPQFLRGDFETAVFVAMKEVEVRVRQLSGAPDSLLGTALMQHAFAPNGVLARGQADRGEIVAEMELFKGAIGLFKNPSSHRPVPYDNATTAAEIVLLADLLLRLLDGR
ncbi:TIGR02391 family protein [Flindersiella endophytica]